MLSVIGEVQMMDDLNRLWESFSLSEMEGAEMEIQKQAWEEGANRGRTCVVGKLITNHLVSKETL